MNRFAGFIPFLLVFATVSACESGKEGCPEGQTKCNDGECYECCINSDCMDNPAMADCSPDYLICNDDYACQCACYQWGQDCSRDPGACCDGLTCDIFTNICMPECIPCESDSDCLVGQYCNCPSFLPCDDGCCKDAGGDHCNKDADCAGGKVCFNGDCVSAPPCEELKECFILPESAVTKQGTTAQFAATVYLNSGALAPGYYLSWASSDENIATAVAGLVTGGLNTGEATITASVDYCEEISCIASVLNYGAVALARVVVVDELAFTPIEGATVASSAEAPVTTDEFGVATLSMEPGGGNPVDITVSHAGYHYVTLKGVESTDVIVHLKRFWDPDQAGGIRGRLDFGATRCKEPRYCDAFIGHSGISIPGSSIDVVLRLMYPERAKTLVDLGGDTFEAMMPGGMEFRFSSGSGWKDSYFTTGVPGSRVAWSIGGGVDSGDFFVIQEPPYPTYTTLMAWFFFDVPQKLPNFYTSLVSNVNIVPIDKVPDTNDIDSDGDTGDLVPDYDQFPDPGMTLMVAMDNTMFFTAPRLPIGTYDEVMLFAGVLVLGAGFVPLGLTAAPDSRCTDDDPDGIIEDPITIHISDVSGRIPEDQVQRVVLAVAFNRAAIPAPLLQTDPEPLRLAAQVMFVDSFSGTHTLPEFLSPAEVTYDPATRHMEITQAPSGADYFRASFQDENGAGWHVLAPDAVSFDLPAAPPEGDRAGKRSFVSIDLESTTYQDLAEFNDANMGDLVEMIYAFSFSEVP